MPMVSATILLDKSVTTPKLNDLAVTKAKLDLNYNAPSAIGKLEAADATTTPYTRTINLSNMEATTIIRVTAIVRTKAHGSSSSDTISIGVNDGSDHWLSYSITGGIGSIYYLVGYFAASFQASNILQPTTATIAMASAVSAKVQIVTGDVSNTLTLLASEVTYIKDPTTTHAPEEG